LYWEEGERGKAEDMFRVAEERLTQLEDDYVKRIKDSKKKDAKPLTKGFSIDESGPDVGEISVGKFKRAEWVAEKLGWDKTNEERLRKFIKLS